MMIARALLAAATASPPSSGLYPPQASQHPTSGDSYLPPATLRATVSAKVCSASMASTWDRNTSGTCWCSETCRS